MGVLIARALLFGIYIKALGHILKRDVKNTDLSKKNNQSRMSGLLLRNLH